MKSVYNRLAVAIALAVLGLAYLIVPVPAHAQSLQMKVTIPFEFYVGQKKLPAGNYTIMQQPGTNSGLLVLGEHQSHPFILTTPITNAHPERNTAVIFNKYADELFLSEAHWKGVETGRRLPMSPLELELAKSITPERIVAGTRNR